MAKKDQTAVDGAELVPDDDEVIIVDDGEQGGGADEGAESLKEQLAAERKRADDADRRANERDAEAKRVTAENARNQTDLEDSRLATIQNAIAATEGKRKDLRARLIAAKTAGDFETEADINIEVAQVATELQRLTEGKNVLENRISDERERAKNPAPVNADPIERAVEKMTPRAANWVRSHPEVIFNPVRNAELVLADAKAHEQGLDPASDAYFDHMNRQMGYGGTVDPDERPVARRQSAPAAPVSRGGSGDATLQPGQIRLTRAERDMADEWGWSYKKYYENKMLVQAESGTKN